MISFSQYLDKDWGRLCELAGQPPTKRRVRDALSPRFAPVVLVRIAFVLHRAGWPRLAKLFSLFNFLVFGMEVPPRLEIGPGLVIMHTQGTVLGAAFVGENFTVYHQVTLGAKDIDFSYSLSKRPTIGNDVIVGVGAKVLGGVVVGDRCIVGANAVVVHDVAPLSTAVGIPAQSISKQVFGKES